MRGQAGTRYKKGANSITGNLSSFESLFFVILIFLVIITSLCFIFYDSIQSLFSPSIKMPSIELYAVVAAKSKTLDEATILSNENKKNGGGGFVVLSGEYTVIDSVYESKKIAEKNSGGLEVLRIKQNERKIQDNISRNTAKSLNTKAAVLKDVIINFSKMNNELKSGEIGAGETMVNMTALRTKLLDLKNSLFDYREEAADAIFLLDTMIVFYLNAFETAIDTSFPLSSNISNLTAKLLFKYI